MALPVTGASSPDPQITLHTCLPESPSWEPCRATAGEVGASEARLPGGPGKVALEEGRLQEAWQGRGRREAVHSSGFNSIL